MKKCLLCQDREADKTGSHIIPHFLMKRIDNQIGEKGRCMELGFVIRKLETKGYFGASVLPEEIERIYGEVDEELIENNDIPYIVDNIFCFTCEKQLGKLENAYAPSLKKTSKNDTNYTSIENGGIGFIFWISILWRISIFEEYGFKLKTKEESKLRRILIKHLTDYNFDHCDKDLNNNIGYKLLRSPNYQEETGTFFHVSHTNVRPYSIMVNEFILFFYFKNTYLKAALSTFYSSEILMKHAEYNTPFKSEKIYSIKEIDLKEIIQKYINDKASIIMNEFVTILDELHRKLGGEGKMKEELKQKILNNIALSQEPIGIKYSLRNVSEITATTIMENNNS